MSSAMLEGVRIIDMTSVVFGPYATQMLADLGAEVIKVEAPEGDQFRLSGKPAKSKGMSPGFLTINGGKQSIVLDLKSEADRQTMTSLLKTADIFIHNVRLKAVEKLGFGPDAVKSINPDTIYVHCVGFGSDGPYDGLQAYDDVIQAASGAATLAGRVDGTGKARYLPSLIADKVAGLYGAQAALAAYIHKLRTGESQFVEVPMFEAFTQFMLVEHLAGHVFDPPNASSCYFRQIDPDRQPFPTKDGYISIVPYTPQSWPVVFGVIEDEGFLEQPGLTTIKEQFLNQHRLYRRLAEITPQRTTEDWLTRFRDARIPCMAVTDMDDVLNDPHLNETGFFQRSEHPSEGLYFQMRNPVRYEKWSTERRSDAPLLGEHSEKIRSELSDDQTPDPSDTAIRVE